MPYTNYSIGTRKQEYTVKQKLLCTKQSFLMIIIQFHNRGHKLSTCCYKVNECKCSRDSIQLVACHAQKLFSPEEGSGADLERNPLEKF